MTNKPLRGPNYEAIKKMMGLGANVNARCNKGQTPLMLGMESGFKHDIELSLDHPKIDLSIENNEGRNALWYHLVYGYDDELVEKMLAHKTKAVNKMVVDLCEKNFPELYNKMKKSYDEKKDE